LDFRRPDDAAQVRKVFARAGFTDRGVLEALGAKDPHAASDQDVPLWLHRTRRATPLDTLIRLFLIGVPVEADAARRAVAPASLDTWAETGLVDIQANSVRATVQIVPVEGMLVASDQPRRIASGGAADYVMGIGSSSRTLANLTVRRPSRNTLDLGTGCGYLAFLAARHSQRVAAVDRNPRAVAIARFNARLNGLENVDCLEGDFFEPVAGEKFDLIVSNPPFVISPERHFIYRDSGMDVDGVCREIVRRSPAFLHEDGFCQILANWAHIAGEDWPERLAGWGRGLGCDILAIRSDTLDAESYAVKWIRHTERDDPEQFARRFQQWVEYYRQERIEAISGGLITLRRRDGAANWFHAEDAPPRMLGPAGDALERAFALRDFLETVADDAALLDARLKVSPDLCLQQQFKPLSEGWAVTASELRLERGLSYSGTIDPYMARLVADCDGKRPLRSLMEELASSAGQDLAAITPACLEVVRRLVARGFLLPAESRRLNEPNR
jgi:SAM-dependent methyltransferase